MTTALWVVIASAFLAVYLLERRVDNLQRSLDALRARLERLSK